MRIGVPNQTDAGETRAAIVPGVVKKLVAQGLEVVVESGLGLRAGATDAAYEAAGARVAAPGGPDAPAADVWSSDIVVTLRPPTARQLDAAKAGGILIGVLAPLANGDAIRRMAERNVTAVSMEYIPRISRAQAMDVLSSQANLAGYKAVILAATHCPKVFPMMITAAGTITPARVFVLGAGVAGLQAIATARRLGAVVEAFDVRAATREQVQSLGARFVELPVAAQDDKATGGYAKEQSEDERKRQAELMAKHVIGADAVIATAAVFGKAPPMLIGADVVGRMPPGGVIVDMAASPEHGRGNCELTRPGEVYTTPNGVTVVGTLNLPGLASVHASQVYAQNVAAYLGLLWDAKNKKLSLNFEDEVVRESVITHEGQVRHPRVREALGLGPPEPAAAQLAAGSPAV